MTLYISFGFKESEVLSQDEINDSKKLTEKKREKLYDIIMKNFDVAVGISTVEEIDKLNILNADFLAMRRALNDLKNIKNEKEYTVLVDGNLKIKGLPIGSPFLHV